MVSGCGDFLFRCRNGFFTAWINQVLGIYLFCDKPPERLRDRNSFFQIW
ncbi:MAG: hypothetical protein HC785_12635 [Calothrix sp. CSU_2_0]|nr:hypothetical protein [Calothrix sp. CSU_2_0]